MKNVKPITFIILLVSLAFFYWIYTWDNREKFYIPPYNSAIKNSPVELGGLKGKNSFIFLKLKFLPTESEGWPNLLQTGPLNDGLRIELSGNKLTLLVRTLWDNRGNPGFKAIELDSNLALNQWHELEFEIINGKYLIINYDGKFFKYENIGIDIDTSRILIGGGFVEARWFRGEITDGFIIKGNYPNSIF
jgi:hypothetical protein